MIPATQLVTLVLLASTLIACSGRSPGDASIAQSSSVQPAANSPSPAAPAGAQTPVTASFNVTSGQAFSVVLPSASGGGYEWHLVDGYDQGVVTLKGTRRGAPPSSGLIGPTADEIFDFTAVGSGQTTLNFSEYRSWEGPAQATAARHYPVTVR